MEVDVCAVSVLGVSLRMICGENGETYPSILINFKSPPKYLAYSLEMGNPYPKPAIGALKSLLSKSGSRLGVASTVVYI